MPALQAESAYKSTLAKLLMGALLSISAMPLLAKPAVWYWGGGAASDQRVCAQTSPGAGWTREGTPFRDSRCSIRVNAF